MKTFYIEIDSDYVITDVLDYKYGDYIEVNLKTPIPNKLISGCYKFINNEVVYFPQLDEELLLEKISILEAENEKLKESQEMQDMDIMFTQEAVDFLMLGSMTMALENKNIKNTGGSNMAGYIASRIMKKGNTSVEAGRDYYVTFLTHSDYSQYKVEVDLILRAEGRENLIVDLTNM